MGLVPAAVCKITTMLPFARSLNSLLVLLIVITGAYSQVS